MAGDGHRSGGAAPARGSRGEAGGGWQLRGVHVEDELEALPKLHVKCLSATIAFSFDSSRFRSKFQFGQLSSE